MAEVKGKITLEISDDYLSAWLLFTPNEEGKLWTLTKINELLDDEMITYGIDNDAILRSYTLFSEGKGFKSEIIAHGKAPELPMAESFKPKACEIPEEIEAILNETIKSHPAPKIEIIKETLVETRFKKESKKQTVSVTVDPAIEETGYYRKGEVVGTFIEAKDGKMGIGVLGHNITPKKNRNSQSPFYLGKGLIKEKNGTVISEFNGFLRKGKNWADIIPFNDHILEISLSKDKSNCIMTLTPGLKHLAAPSVDLIYKQIEKLNYDPNLLLSRNYLEKYILQILESGKKKSVSISTSRDALIELKINSTQTEASILLQKGCGKGESLNLNKVSKIINESNLKGINIADLKSKISQFYNSEKQNIEIPLCKGLLPERGKDRNINFAVEFQSLEFVSKLKEKILDKPGSVDAYSSIKDFPIEKVEQMALVKEGERLFSLGNLSPGKDGMDVYGNKIAGIPGNDPKLYLYEGIDYKEGLCKAEEAGVFEIYFDEEKAQLFGRIRKHRDAQIVIRLSENHMQALINIDLPQGTGFYADVERIKKALDDAEVIEGILDDRIEEAAAISQKDDLLTDFLVAEGKYPLDSDSELRLFLDIDQQNKNSIAVKASDKLGEIVKKEKDSSAGYTVLGEILESDGLDTIEIGKNIEVKEDEETGMKTLYATAYGQLFFDRKKIFIKDTLVVEGNLTSTMGKVIFPGNIQIGGSVQSQVYVKAGNNIQVAEVVESALLAAEGNITVGRGVKGNKKAALHSQKSISMLYAEETNLMALIQIEAKKALLHCTVKCNGFLKTDRKGKILGGLLKVKEGLSTGIIGSESGVHTMISFGQDYLVEDQIIQTDKDIQKIQQQILKVDQIIQKIQMKGGRNEVLLEAREKKRKALKIMEKKNLKIFLLREKFEMHYQSAVKIYDTLYPGTVFECHGRELKIETPLKSVEVYFDQNSGKILYKPL